MHFKYILPIYTILSVSSLILKIFVIYNMSDIEFSFILSFEKQTRQ